MFWLLTPNEKRQKTTKSVQTGASLSSFKKRGGGSSFLELSPAPSQTGPNQSLPPPTPPRLASLRFAYTYTQPRPSAGFRNNIYIRIHTQKLCRMFAQKAVELCAWPYETRTRSHDTIGSRGPSTIAIKRAKCNQMSHLQIAMDKLQLNLLSANAANAIYCNDMQWHAMTNGQWTSWGHQSPDRGAKMCETPSTRWLKAFLKIPKGTTWPAACAWVTWVWGV